MSVAQQLNLEVISWVGESSLCCCMLHRNTGKFQGFHVFITYFPLCVCVSECVDAAIDFTRNSSSTKIKYD